VGDAVAIPYFIAQMNSLPKPFMPHAWDCAVTPDVQAHCWTIRVEMRADRMRDVESLARALFDLEMREEAKRVGEVVRVTFAADGFPINHDVEGQADRLRATLDKMWSVTKLDARTRCLARAQEIVEAMQ
jgi:hypothetical protein